MMSEAALGQLLLARGLVTQDQLRALLGRRRAGDPRGLSELLRDAGLVAPAALQQLLAGVPDTASDPGLRDPPQPLRSSGRFGTREGDLLSLRPELDVRVERLLGEGGMGAVYLVRDGGLARLAALKLMKPGGSPVRAVRFRREAAVTARLDHPGIPPVYATGRTPAGQDYLLMRYVAGKSLAELLSWGRDESGHTASEGAPDQRTLLDALVKVGEALAFAHYRGIVHRDVKPANIMVGAFGEVLLMDWGLARDLAETSQQDEQVRHDLRAALESTTRRAQPQAHLTQDGAVLGTPCYMAPEQARGEDVDARADVFALGSILTEVLTGEPAVIGGSTLEVISKTSQGRIDRPSARDPSVPPELDAIAGRALGLLPEERYPTAERFASDLKAWLEGRPVSVYRYTRLEQARRLARRHPAAVVGLLAVLLVGGVGLLAVSGAREAERQEAVADARRAAEAAWTVLEEARGAEPGARLGRALKALQGAQRWRLVDPRSPQASQAEFRAAMALGEVSQEAEQWELAAQAFAQAADLGVDDARAQAAGVRVDEARSAERRRRREAVLGVVSRVMAGGMDEKAGQFQEAVFQVVGYSDPATVRLMIEQLDQVSQELLRVQREVWLEAALPDPDEARAGERAIDGLAAALEARDRAGLSGRPGPEAEVALRAAEERLLRRLVRAAGRARTALQHVALRQREALGPGRLSVARLACEVLGRVGRLDPAAAEDALARYLAAEGDGIRATAGGLALCRLGGTRAQRLVLDARERFHDEHFRDNVDQVLLQLLGEDDLPLEEPTARGHLRRGQARLARLRFADAAADMTRALELDPRLARAWADRGIARMSMGDPRGAVEDHTRAIELEPGRAGFWANRAGARAALGDVVGSQKDFDRALELDPGDSRLYANRGLFRLQTQGDREGALRDYDKALELDPTNAAGWLNRSQLLLQMGELARAREDAERGLALVKDDGRFWAARANVKEVQGDGRGALEDLNRAIELSPREAASWNNRGNVYFGLSDPRAALQDFRRAVELDPQQETFWRNVARAQLALDAPREALEAASRAIDLAPRSAQAWVLKGQAHLALQQSAAAREALDRAVAVGPRSVMAWRERARLRIEMGDGRGALEDLEQLEQLAPDDRGLADLRAQAHARSGDRRAALAALDRELDARPDDLHALCRRGQLKFMGGDHEGALVDFSRAIEGGMKSPGVFVDRATVYYQLDRVAEARSDYDQALALDPRYVKAWLGKSVLDLNQGHARAALEACDRVVELDPEHPVGWAQRAMARLALEGQPRPGSEAAARALQDAERAVALGPAVPMAFYARGRARLLMGQHEGAVADAKQGAALAPDMLEFLLLQGQALFLLERRPESLKTLTVYLERGGEDKDGMVRRLMEQLRGR